ncbi:MAG: hypothetical protein R2769_10200 [Saprospiraceae bacterium]
MRKNLLKYIKRLVVKGKIPFGSSFPFDEGEGLPELMEGYKIWYDQSASTADFYKNVKNESHLLLEDALASLPDHKVSTQKSNSTESMLVKAFLYLFPPQSSITMGTWQMRL